MRGIDINMGCPLPFSTLGGMGSALLSKPDTVRDILTTLRRNLPNVLSAKIRLLGARLTRRPPRPPGASSRPTSDGGRGSDARGDC